MSRKSGMAAACKKYQHRQRNSSATAENRAISWHQHGAASAGETRGMATKSIGMAAWQKISSEIIGNDRRRRISKLAKKIMKKAAYQRQRAKIIAAIENCNAIMVSQQYRQPKHRKHMAACGGGENRNSVMASGDTWRALKKSGGETACMKTYRCSNHVAGGSSMAA